MKKRCMALMAMVAILALAAKAQQANEVRQAVRMAMSDAQASLAKSGLAKLGSISLLPIKHDQDGYVEGLVKNAVSSAGLTYVEGKDDPFWGDVLKEVEWDERKSDILDQNTLVKFGKLKATQVLMYGVLREASVVGQRIFVEIELHASSLETKQHVWGGVFVKRFYMPGAVEGILSAEQLPPELRDVLKRSFFEQASSLLAKAEPKLKTIRTVAVVPLGGDMDQYVTGLVRDLITQSHTLSVKNIDAATLGEARVILRDPAQRSDAVLYGAVRDISQRLVREWPMSKIYEVSTETQLYIESGANEVLWSATISSKGEYARTITVWTWICNNKKFSLIMSVVIVGFLAFLVIAQKASRVR